MKGLEGADNTNISTYLSCKKKTFIRREGDWSGNISEQLPLFQMAASNFEITGKLLV